MQAAYQAGVNFFDNAEAYATGKSEQLMGEAPARLGWPPSLVPGVDQGSTGVSTRAPTPGVEPLASGIVTGKYLDGIPQGSRAEILGFVAERVRDEELAGQRWVRRKSMVRSRAIRADAGSWAGLSGSAKPCWVPG